MRNGVRTKNKCMRVRMTRACEDFRMGLYKYFPIEFRVIDIFFLWNGSQMKLTK